MLVSKVMKTLEKQATVSEKLQKLEMLLIKNLPHDRDFREASYPMHLAAPVTREAEGRCLARRCGSCQLQTAVRKGSC
ncbi:hypothetical protein ACP70R_025730 [Stipagrostis hirtigluma subsp. patula]